MTDKEKHAQHVRVHIITMFKEKDPSGTIIFQSVELIPYITDNQMKKWWGNVNREQLKENLNKYVREYLYQEYGELEKERRGKYKLNPNGPLFKRLRREVNE